MRLLATADIHGSQYRLNILLKNIKNYSPDIVVLCGDLTQFGPGEVAKNFLEQIPVETFAIFGNIDTPDVDQAITSSKAYNLDLKRVVRNDISFVGIGGTIPSPLSKVIIREKQRKIPIEESINEKTILISHEPPYKTQDRVFFGHYSGSRELRNLIEKTRPRLVLCGHIHEDPGISKVDNTTIVNCSMGKRGEGAIIKINEKLSVKMLN